MFENLERAYKHFMVLIPTTIAIIFLVLVVAYGSFRAAFILLLPIPFAFAAGAVALYLRHMNLNVSTGVGFATLFGIAIMDGVLMFKGISKHRLEGASVDDAIIHGRIDRLRPGLMTSLVAILGLLPAALATEPGVRRATPPGHRHHLRAERLRAVHAVYHAGVLSHLRAAAARIAACPRRTRPDSPSRCPTYPPSKSSDCWSISTSAATRRTSSALPPTPIGSSPTSSSSSRRPSCWASPSTPLHMVVLTPEGKRFVEATPEERKTLWRERLLTLRLFREVYELLQRQPDRAVDSDFVLETIVMCMPYENYEKVFNTFIRWARFGGLFVYDETTQRISLP